MKGIVFTEFVEIVEKKFGIAIADQMIVEAGVASGGAYSSVATYDHAELVAMVVTLSKLTGTPVSDLVRTFGESLFERFATLYPAFFVGVASALDFLALVEMYIHPEVRKLYPDAELPKFEIRRTGTDQIEMIYRSSRHLEDLAEGLIRGCAAHFRESINLERHEEGRSNR